MFELIVDKVWPRALRCRFVARMFPRARWIHVMRDGRDCFCSARHHPNIPQGRALSVFATDWVRRNRDIERFVPGERKIVVKYEDFVAFPREVIPKLMEFLGEEVEEAQYFPGKRGLAPSIRKREYHKRLIEPLDARSVGRYRDELTASALREFERIAGNTLARNGYVEQRSTSGYSGGSDLDRRNDERP